MGAVAELGAGSSRGQLRLDESQQVSGTPLPADVHLSGPNWIPRPF